MDELSRLLDRWSGEDLHALPAPALLNRVRVLVAAQNRLAAELARTVRRAELAQAAEHDGLKTMASWLRGHCRLSPSAAAQAVKNGRALELLPALAAACDVGRVTSEQVAVAAPVVKPENLALAADQAVDLAEVDAILTRVAVREPHADLVHVVARYLTLLDQDGPEPDPTEQRELLFATHPDGTLSFRGQLDVVGGEKFQAAIESIVQANRPAGDERTRAQRQADALVQLMDNQLAYGHLPQVRGVKPQLGLLIRDQDLFDPAAGLATAEAGVGATLSAARARWAACDAQITRIVLDPDGLPLDVGRTQRLVPAHIRKAVEIRDKGCVFAGCRAPTWWCDTHHKIEWAFGGETSLDNSALLCECHHTQVHHGFRIERDGQGRWHTWRPDGTEILTDRAEPAAA
jgi:hypothetical protein